MLSVLNNVVEMTKDEQQNNDDYKQNAPLRHSERVEFSFIANLQPSNANCEPPAFERYKSSLGRQYTSSGIMEYYLMEYHLIEYYLRG